MNIPRTLRVEVFPHPPPPTIAIFADLYCNPSTYSEI